MTGITYTFETEDELINMRLNQLVESLTDLSGFHKGVGAHLNTSIDDNFRNETAPDGTAWKQLMPATIRRREKRGQTPIAILRASGGLRGSVNVQTTAQDVRAGSPAEHAAIHQLGGEIKKKARKGKAFGRDNVAIPAHTIKIPARPFIGIGPDDEVAIVEIADAWLNP